MSIFRKIFNSITDPKSEVKEQEMTNDHSDFYHLPVDEQFTLNFKKNGGKFLYCENTVDLTEQFENILEENDWFESQALCFEPVLFELLKSNRIAFENVRNPTFLLTSCESLIAEDGSIMFSSKQIKQLKPVELPANIVLVASTSRIVESKSDGLRKIKNQYTTDYPTNITTIKYFEKVKEEDFLHYGSTQKNLYLLLLEDL